MKLLLYESLSPKLVDLLSDLFPQKQAFPMTQQQDSQRRLS
jgi:hypothetical protein